MFKIKQNFINSNYDNIKCGNIVFNVNLKN
jgi:hypothetical protein